MQQHPRCAYASDKNWLYTVYAAVLLKALDDLERTRTTHQAIAIHWFAGYLDDVTIVCAICRLKPARVYLEVARCLRRAKIRCPQITFIRWHLRHGDLLWEIRVPAEDQSYADRKAA
jgi:hypothetical protein